MKKTAQEIFDITLNHLRKQGHAATASISFYGHYGEYADRTEQRCAYRAPNGDKCAAGIHIPDELYDAAMESRNIGDVIEKYPQVKELLGEHQSLLRAMQRAHDTYLPRVDADSLHIELGLTSMAIWETEMRSIAAEFGLQYKAV